MKKYGGADNNSGVKAYEVVPSGIVVMFVDGNKYLYNNKKPGKKHVHEMIAHAEAGSGLATYINQHVRDNYAAKLD
ncbi:MAG: hypothetical protein V4649_17275 [Bacteroidota bacterium]